MKIVWSVLIVLLLFLQYKLWFENGGVQDAIQLKKAVAAQTAENNDLKAKNAALMAEVTDLKHGLSAIEERARAELGMVKKDEQYYQIVENAPVTTAPTSSTVASTASAKR